MTPPSPSPAARPLTPVTLVTGFLGAGKTTLLKHLLESPSGLRLGLIVNEIGEIDIDGRLLLPAGGQDGLVRLANGCVCCSVRLDLARAVHRLAASGGRFDVILIETTGLADPRPVIQTFHNIPELARAARLDAVVTVADAAHLPAQLASEEAATAQLSLADFIILNKTDLVTPAALEELRHTLLRLNPAAEIIPAQYSRVDWRRILDARAFDLSVRLDADPALLDELRRSAHSGLQSAAFRFDRPFLLEPFAARVDALSRTAKIWRSKGFLHVKHHRRRGVFHGVCSRFDIFWGEPWQKTETPHSELVFIGRGFDPAALRAELETCLA